MARKYTVYAFANADPRDLAIRYIGITSRTPAKRLAEIKSHHERPSWKKVSAWLNSLSTSPLIIILETDPSDGLEAEARWIAHYRQHCDLFNKADGGEKNDGWKHSQKWKDENARRVRGRVLSDETKAKIGEGNRGNARPDLKARNISNRRLSPKDLIEIREMLDEGYSMKDIGTSFGVSAGLICMIKSGKRYASVP